MLTYKTTSFRTAQFNVKKKLKKEKITEMNEKQIYVTQ